MLPLGYLGPAPGWGKPRQTRLSHDEQQTLMTLWAIFPSPLMIGGDLTAMDSWTQSLLTNPEVLAVDQHSTGNKPSILSDQIVAWTAESSEKHVRYLAVFNRSETPIDAHYSWKELGLDGSKYAVRDLWARKDAGSAESFTVKLPAHACVLYQLKGAE
jgi:hypothetical protein